MALYGAIEAGGTKFVCAVGSGPDDVRAKVRIATTSPRETLEQCLAFFHSQPKLDALGVGCFGPLELRRAERYYGHVTATPKPGWTHADIVGPLARGLAVPIGFDTDVNAAVLGEAERQRMRVVTWSVDPWDWNSHTSPKQIAHRVLGAVEAGSIVLMHDGGGDQSATIQALPKIIRGIRRMGLHLVALPTRA